VSNQPISTRCRRRMTTPSTPSSGLCFSRASARKMLHRAIRRHRIWSSPCMRVLFTVLLLLWSELLLLLLLSCPVRHLLRLVLGAAAAAAAAPPQLVPLPFMSAINGWVLEDAIEKALRKCVCEKSDKTDSNGQNASVPQHRISTKAIALMVGARPTAPCASGALLSPMLSTRELQAPRPWMKAPPRPLSQKRLAEGLPGCRICGRQQRERAA
jgi:hypothetical protein